MTVQKQTMDEVTYTQLGDWAEYRGRCPELASLLGVLVPTRQIEAVVPVGERDEIYVEHLASGEMTAPWRTIAITEFDDGGREILRPIERDEFLEEVEDYTVHMMQWQLAEVGFTDGMLAKACATELGEEYGANPGTRRRRQVYDRVMAKRREPRE